MQNLVLHFSARSLRLGEEEKERKRDTEATVTKAEAIKSQVAVQFLNSLGCLSVNKGYNSVRPKPSSCLACHLLIKVVGAGQR